MKRIKFDEANFASNYETSLPKVLSLLKIVVFSWNFSNENVEKSVVYNAVWEDITEIVATVFQIFN